MTDYDLIGFPVKNVSQFIVLNYIMASFQPEFIAKLELLENGLKLTDCTGDYIDFIYNGTTVVCENRRK